MFLALRIILALAVIAAAGWSIAFSVWRSYVALATRAINGRPASLPSPAIEVIPMSEAPDTTAPVATAGEDTSTAAAYAASVIGHPATAAVIQAIQADPTVAPSNAAATAARVLNALMPIVQPVEQLSRASARTQGWVAISLAALSALIDVFYPHPNAA